MWKEGLSYGVRLDLLCLRQWAQSGLELRRLARVARRSSPPRLPAQRRLAGL